MSNDFSNTEKKACRVCGHLAVYLPCFDNLCRTCNEKRELYAASALTGILSNSEPVHNPAEYAMEQAEIMLALDRGNKKEKEEAQ